MVGYIEIKKFIQRIFLVKEDIGEDEDIVVKLDDKEFILHNQILKQEFERMMNCEYYKLELVTNNYREIAIQYSDFIRIKRDETVTTDAVNGIKYTIGTPSLAYCMFLLYKIINIEDNKEKINIIMHLRSRARMLMQRYKYIEEFDNPLDLIKIIFRINTIRIDTEKITTTNDLKNYASSFEFLFMYKNGRSISEYNDIEDIFSRDPLGVRYYNRHKEEIIPQRIYNRDVLDYYAMANEARDPFTMYISFYHVIEHYFDAVFRKKLTKDVQNKLTHPDFSYKSEDKIYELAKYIKKHMKSDDESGKGNELESLKYVLMEYVPISELKKRLDALDSNAVMYYQDNFVPFNTSNKTKIAWANESGVYTNLATRIYETRNSLVHSKSEQIKNQYRPYEHRKELLKEITLIKSIAEIVLINTSDII